LKTAAVLATDDAQPEEVRIEAIELTGHDSFATASEVLSPLVAPRFSNVIQRAAVRTLTAYPDKGVTGLMLEQWRGLSPAMRTEVVDQLLARADRTNAVLDAVESGV